MSAQPLRLLVLDAYDAPGRAALAEVGCTPAGALYRAMLLALEPDAAVEVIHPADTGVKPRHALADYDGLCWTGSSLTVHREGDARVRQMLELVRAAYRAGVPQFGSCFGAQLAVTAAGGACARNPRGREFGIARRITLSSAGAKHPLFADRPRVFDALCSHQDEVVRLPDGARMLASNDWSAVQAVDVRHEGGRFWAVQYHPEYDLAEIAGLCALRAAKLVEQGHFESDAEAAAFRRDAHQLAADPAAAADAARRLDVSADLLEADVRQAETRCWLASLGPR